MNTRITLALIFLAGAVSALTLVYSGKFEQNTSGILSNVGTEFIGILFTVLIIDWMYERRTAAADRRSIALSILQKLDHAIWVWQGDRRGFNLDELYTRAQMALQDDPLPSYTQNLFMRLGSHCVSHLNLKGGEIGSSTLLADALKNLSRLEGIRDFERDFDFDEFREILVSSVPALASACSLPPPRTIEIQPTAHRISSEEHQHYRHFGKQIDGSYQPIWGLEQPFKRANAE